MPYSLVINGKLSTAEVTESQMPKSLDLGGITRSWMTPETFPYTTASLLSERYAQLKYRINNHFQLNDYTHGSL